MRLFVAIELPDRQKQALRQLRTEIPAARWLPPGQLHLTLAFLGEVAAERTGLLAEALAAIREAPFELAVGGSGCFPQRSRPRVLWAGVTAAAGLLRLAARVQAAVRACGLELEERPFSPHITLARLKVPCPREVGLFLDRHRQLDLGSFPVTGFTLFQSRLSPEGALHLPLRVFPLLAADSDG